MYVVAAIVRKRIGLDLEFCALLQILSVPLFEKICLIRVVTQTVAQPRAPDAARRLQMFTS
jgi:hypothetical protein